MSVTFYCYCYQPKGQTRITALFYAYRMQGSAVWSCSVRCLLARLLMRRIEVFRIILGKQYLSYENACQVLNLPTLESRRRTLSEDFVKALAKHPTCHNWLPPRRTVPRSLRHTLLYQQFPCRTRRYQNSPLPYCVDLLNSKRLYFNT